MKAIALHIDQLASSEDNSTSLDDEFELVERAKSTPDAFGQLFQLYYGRTLTYAYRCTLNFAVAEELTSNTFFKALRALPKYRHRSRFGFSNWVYRIATNEIRMHWRKQRKRQTVSLGLGSPEVFQRTYFDTAEVENEEAHREKMRVFAQLHEAVAKLPERYRSVIILLFFEGLKYGEVADVLGKRIGTVKSQTHRGLRRLRVILEQDATITDAWHLDK